MAAPNPLIMGFLFYQSYGLGIMDEKDVGLRPQNIFIPLVDFKKVFTFLGSKRFFFSVERVMDFFRDLEKLIAALNHIPTRINAQFL